MTPHRALIEAAKAVVNECNQEHHGFALLRAVHKLEAAVSSAKVAEFDSFNEAIEQAALYCCSRCRSEVPLVVMSNGCTYHKYDRSDYRECNAIGIRSLKRLPLKEEVHND